VRIVVDDLSGPEIAGLISEHLRNMRAQTPPESIHALDLEKLRRPDITFWTAWDGAELLGCGALKELDPRHGEIKSMRTAAAHLRKGIAAAMLTHILEEARRRGYRRVSLETGAMAAFSPAHRLYERFGFQPSEPFGDYVPDPNSAFMTLEL
jgi:putative acetyltransferase